MFFGFDFFVRLFGKLNKILWNFIYFFFKVCSCFRMFDVLGVVFVLMDFLFNCRGFFLVMWFLWFKLFMVEVFWKIKFNMNIVVKWKLIWGMEFIFDWI